MKIQYKIILLVIIISGIINSAFTIFTIISEKNKEYERLSEKINTNSHLIQSAVQGALWRFDMRALEESLNSFYADENIYSIELIDYSNFLKYKKEKNIKNISMDEIIENEIDIIMNNIKLGKIQIQYISGFNQKKIEDFTKKIIQLTILLIFINSIAIFIMLKIMTKPVSYLLKGMNSVNQGNLNYRINIKTNDEFGKMSLAFNDMSANLQKITASRDELNKEIANRIKIEKELREALSNVKILKGFIPICSNCGKMRDDKGYWKKIEVYMEKYSDAQFSHTLCVDCLNKLYPDFSEKIINKDKSDTEQ